MLYLVRHGESMGNISKRYCGLTDVELSAKGVLQAKKTGQNLKKFSINQIYTSSLKRAKETAKIISNEINVGLCFKDCLKEINFGIFENKTWQEMLNEHRNETDNWIEQGFKYKFPEGESYQDLIERISIFMENLEDESVVVTHFGVIQSILLYFNAVNSDNIWDYHIYNGDILILNNRKIDGFIRCE